MLLKQENIDELVVDITSVNSINWSFLDNSIRVIGGKSKIQDKKKEIRGLFQKHL